MAERLKPNPTTSGGLPEDKRPRAAPSKNPRGAAPKNKAGTSALGARLSEGSRPIPSVMGPMARTLKHQPCSQEAIRAIPLTEQI